MKYISIALYIATALSAYPYILMLWKEGPSAPLWIKSLFALIVLISLSVAVVGVCIGGRNMMILNVVMLVLNCFIILYIAHTIAVSINKKVVLKDAHQTMDQGNLLIDDKSGYIFTKEVLQDGKLVKVSTKYISYEEYWGE